MVLLRKYALLWAGSGACTANWYDIHIPSISRCLCRNIGVRGRSNTPNEQWSQNHFWEGMLGKCCLFVVTRSEGQEQELPVNRGLGALVFGEPGTHVPISHIQEPKKGINIKNLAETPPSQTPPQGTPDPANSLCFGPVFPLKYRKMAYRKNFERGGLGGPTILYAEFLRVFCLHLTNTFKSKVIADAER